MASSEFSKFQLAPTAKQSSRHKSSACLADCYRYLGGLLVVFFLVWTLWCFTAPNLNPTPTPIFGPLGAETEEVLVTVDSQGSRSVNLGYDSSEKTFYDDPELSFSIGTKMKNWDEKRRKWLELHPSFMAEKESRVLVVTGSQPSACKNPIGDHLLLRFFKNKVDYCRIHGYDIFYNNALLHPKMTTYWAKLPVVRAAMIAHPEAEWIWWVDSDALITDMEFKLPLERYRNHNLIVNGWAHLIHDQQSWTGLNAGVFLIRNCQWSMDFMEVWASMGPQTPKYEEWGHILRSTFKDKIFPESDDQTSLSYLIYKKNKLTDKIYLEEEYSFAGYWKEIVGNLDNITARYEEMDKGGGGVLRRRHAEKVTGQYSAFREEYLRDAGIGRGGGWRRPFITHFTGCQPCSGDHNQMYSGESCWDGMRKALNFADNQVLRRYSFVHPTLLDSSVVEAPFDYPA